MSVILLVIVVLATAHIAATGTCTRKMDLLICVDVSSINCVDTEQCPEWNAVLQFVKDLVDSLTIGDGDTRVAFISVTDVVKMEFSLKKHTDKKSLLSAIAGLSYKKGELNNLLSSIPYFLDIFNLVLGERLDVPNVVIGITDGFPGIDLMEPVAVSSALQKIGAKVIPVCIAPGCTESFATGVASDPKQANVTYYLLDNYLSINSIKDNLAKQTCSFGQTKLF